MRRVGSWRYLCAEIEMESVSLRQFLGTLHTKLGKFNGEKMGNKKNIKIGRKSGKQRIDCECCHKLNIIWCCGILV